MILDIVLFLIGVPFGRFWFGVIPLPIIYGVPRASAWVLRGRLRPSAVFFYIGSALLWSGLFLLVAIVLTFVWPSLVQTLLHNYWSQLGQTFGAILGIAQMISAGGRRDLDLDFRQVVAKYQKV